MTRWVEKGYGLAADKVFIRLSMCVYSCRCSAPERHGTKQHLVWVLHLGPRAWKGRHRGRSVKQLLWCSKLKHSPPYSTHVQCGYGGLAISVFFITTARVLCL